MNLNDMTREEKEELLRLLEEQKYRESGKKFYTHWNEETRLEYSKHMDFFAKGATHHQRCFMAANRVGKSEAGAYEMACHLTGLYPDWWEGKRFNHAIKAWACGVNSKTVRDTVQLKLLGEMNELGTGLIPREKIDGKPFKTQGTAETYDTVNVKHISGGISTLQFKSYEQGRKAFEGWAGHVIWLDEECPIEIYSECLMRTATTKGIIFLTFTPLLGMSEVVVSFLESEEKATFDPDKIVITASWDDAPHLDEETKNRLFAGLPPHQREMRSKGIPKVGSGAIYPVNIDDLLIEPFAVPEFWKQSFGLDVGWNRTAAIWLAIDPDTGMHYLYSEHYMGEALPMVHCEAINARGDWIPGCIDPASRGRSQFDGTQLLEQYKQKLSNLTTANNAVETGLHMVWELMAAGKLKIFTSLVNTKKELSKYSRDVKGHVIKKDDHLMDAMRYAIATKDIARAKPLKNANTSMTPNVRWNGY